VNLGQVPARLARDVRLFVPKGDVDGWVPISPSRLLIEAPRAAGIPRRGHRASPRRLRAVRLPTRRV